MSDVNYQSKVHGKLTLRHNKDGTVDKYRNTKKRVSHDRPFQGGPGGVGIGGMKRKKVIDSYSD